MSFVIAFEFVELALLVASGWFALDLYARRLRPHWSGQLTRRRLAVLLLLALLVVGVKVSEDVLAEESGPIDTAVLWWIRGQVPSASGGFFETVTRTGSATVLLPIAMVGAAALLFRRRRFEAGLLVGSAVGATLVVYTLKTLVGRTRPGWPSSAWPTSARCASRSIRRSRATSPGCATSSPTATAPPRPGSTPGTATATA